MKILVVGGGGREHALTWKLAQEAEVICAPGNPGIAEDCEVVPVATSDFAGIAKLACDRNVDLVVVGPEDPLVAGLADVLDEKNIAVFGPGASGARLEASKAFSKQFMREAAILTAQFESFTEPDAAIDYARRRFRAGFQVAVKASGNALGKGVVVCSVFEEAEQAIRQMMVERVFGDAGATVVVEDRLVGPEFSLLTIVGDSNSVNLPISQDHKRAYDGDKGPNTGGMGTFSPVDWVDPLLTSRAQEGVVAPALATLWTRGIGYRGILFSGLLVQNGNPHCLEYNVRFGDPETQSVVLRLGKGLANALFQSATGALVEAPEVLPNAAVSVVIASEGYPDSPKKGVPISIDPQPAGVKLFHAGTALRDGQLVTNGGRILTVSASAPTLAEAKYLAYEGVACVHIEGAFHRKDIASHVW